MFTTKQRRKIGIESTSTFIDSPISQRCIPSIGPHWVCMGAPRAIIGSSRQFTQPWPNSRTWLSTTPLTPHLRTTKLTRCRKLTPVLRLISKGAKRTNETDFANYILEGVLGKRTVYLPPIIGWQSRKAFRDAVFVAYDEEDPNNLYGHLYLPRHPIMQADGQTPTAALFHVRGLKGRSQGGGQVCGHARN